MRSPSSHLPPETAMQRGDSSYHTLIIRRIPPHTPKKKKEGLVEQLFKKKSSKKLTSSSRMNSLYSLLGRDLWFSDNVKGIRFMTQLSQGAELLLRPKESSGSHSTVGLVCPGCQTAGQSGLAGTQQVWKL